MITIRNCNLCLIHSKCLFEKIHDSYSLCIVKCNHAVRTYSTKRQSSSDYCVDLVRRYDYENFLCTLLLPKTITSAAFSFRAFNVEIAQVQDMVSNQTLGLMRLQFWKDAIDNIYSGCSPHHPVALALTRVLGAEKKISKMWFTRLIQAREERLSNHPFVDITALEKYAEHTVSPIYYLLLEYLGIANVEVDHVASHVGKAQGITNLLRGMSFNVKSGVLNLPINVMLKHSVSQEDILRGRKKKDFQNIVYDVACCAKQHVKLAQSMKDKVPKEVCNIFLPLKATDVYLDKLEKADFDVFNPVLRRRSALLPFRLWWQSKQHTF